MTMPNGSAQRYLILARHGEALHNVEEFNNSNPEHPQYKPAPLTETGKMQARISALRLVEQGFTDETIEAVFVSPLPRTMETAAIFADAGVFTASKIIIDHRLIECQFGELEGQSIHRFPTGDCWDLSRGHEYGGETDTDVLNRVKALYDEAVTTYRQGHIVFISHGSPSRELLGMLTGKRDRLDKAEVRPFPLVN